MSESQGEFYTRIYPKVKAERDELLSALKLAFVVISQHYPEHEDCCKDRIAVIQEAIRKAERVL